MAGSAEEEAAKEGQMAARAARVACEVALAAGLALHRWSSPRLRHFHPSTRIERRQWSCRCCLGQKYRRMPSRPGVRVDPSASG